MKWENEMRQLEQSLENQALENEMRQLSLVVEETYVSMSSAVSNKLTPDEH